MLYPTSQRSHANPFRSAAIEAKRLLVVIFSLTALLLLPGLVRAQQATLTDDTSYPKTGNVGGPTGGPAGGQASQSELTLKVRGPGAATGAAAAFVKFKLTGGTQAGVGDLPSGTPGGHVAKATLKLFVNGVGAGGSFDVYRVTAPWAEGGATAPPYDAASPVATGVQVTTANSFVTIDITPLVKQWLDYDPNNPAAGGLPNHGLALVTSAAAPNTSLEFDSKEATQTSHQAQLGVVLSHAKTADQATMADHATTADSAATAATANALVASAIVSGNQVNGDLANATIDGSRVNGAVASATNAATADAARGVVSAAGDADIASPAAGQLYFNTTLNVFRQYDGIVWQTIDAGLAGQLSSAGTLNAPSNPVDWTQLKNVPANAAFGYAAGTGISINPSNAIANTGVLSLSASGPLTASGGQNPTISLSGTVPVANGGTGLSSVGAAGRFLRSNGSAWTSAPLAAADVPAGSTNYIQNSAAQQLTANFNISGNGTLGGSLTANAVNTATQYNVGGQRVLSAPGLASRLYVGINAGNSSTEGANNSFFGFNTGSSNTTGSQNSFFGTAAGFANTNGISNSFFGVAAGNSNITGSANSFFGMEAGRFNTQGSNNTFVGVGAGRSNTVESNNTFVGALADGAPGVTNATAIGANAQVAQSNTMVLGTGIVTVRVPGSLNVAGSLSGNGSGLTNVNASTLNGQPAAAFGDITSVTAGDGLTGGSASGDAALSLNTVFTDARYARLAGDNRFEGTQVINGSVAASGVVSGSGLSTAGQVSGTTGSFSGGSGFATLTVGQRTVGPTFVAVHGVHLAEVGDGVGILGEARGDHGSGVFGRAFGVNGTGVIADGKVGVFASANRTDGVGVKAIAEGHNTTGVQAYANFPTGPVYGVHATAVGADGVGVYGSGGLYGVFGLAGGSSGAAGLFEASGNGRIIKGVGSGVEVFSVDHNGKVTASSFVGDGSGLTNVSAAAGSLSGVVPAAKGGTGLSSAGEAGNFLRSGGGGWTSAPLAPADVPAGSASYIQNTTALQPGASFNISGDGTAGGTLSAHAINAETQFNIGGSRVLGASGASNLFVGQAAGQVNTGSENSFMGAGAGNQNSSGNSNTFFGIRAGVSNNVGSLNTVIGAEANVGAGNLTNATAIGAHAQASQNNSLILGSINGTNGAMADTSVGIGTSAPKQKLEIQGGNILIGSPGQGIILKSPDGATCRLLTIDNSGQMALTPVGCP